MNVLDVWHSYNSIKNQNMLCSDGKVIFDHGPINEFLAGFLLVIHEDIPDELFIDEFCKTCRNLIKADQKIGSHVDDIEFLLRDDFLHFKSRWESINEYLQVSKLSMLGINTGTVYFAGEQVREYVGGKLYYLAAFHHVDLLEGVSGFMDLFHRYLQLGAQEKENIKLPDSSGVPRLKAIALAQYYKYITNEGQAITEENRNEIAIEYSRDKVSRKLYQLFNEYTDRNNRLMSRGSGRMNKDHLKVFDEAMALLDPESESFKRAKDEKKSFERYN